MRFNSKFPRDSVGTTTLRSICTSRDKAKLVVDEETLTTIIWHQTSIQRHILTVTTTITLREVEQLWKSYCQTAEWKDIGFGTCLRWVEFSICHYRIFQPTLWIWTFPFRWADTTSNDNFKLITNRFKSALSIDTIHDRPIVPNCKPQ
jgi:hypothetical protein